MQILSTRGIDTARISTDSSEDPWRNLRDLMYEGRVSIPGLAGDPPPVLLLREELLSLTRAPNGRIDHPADGSKDLADAMACAVLGAVEVGGEEEDTSPRAHLDAADFGVGYLFDLPIGVDPATAWIAPTRTGPTH